MSASEVVLDAHGRVSAHQLAELDAACFAPGDAWSEQSWQQELDGADRIVLVVAPVASGPVAAATFQVVADTADLHRVMVRPTARGRRLGELLLREGFRCCSQRGAERMLLEVEAGNLPALVLYRRLGFEQVAARDDYYGPGRHAQVLQRSLAGVAGSGNIGTGVPAGADEGSLVLAATEGGRR